MTDIIQITPRYVLVGGTTGVPVIYAIVRNMGNLGSAKAALLIVIPQIIITYAIELFGLFGVKKAPLAWDKIIEATIAVGGIIIFER